MTVTRGGDELGRTTMSMNYYHHNQYPYVVDDTEESRTFFSALPREFQVIQESRVPLLQSVDDPKQDFIILAEFSELEGPIPLCTIPTKIPDTIDICLNNFAVHLMSTDYQVNAVGHFKISEDTQVLRKNVFKNIHVFMQYFTLYDIKARGFVRPFCFGYVSRDHVKLDKRLDVLINQFDQMTKVLKQANRNWFTCELEQYLDKLSKAKDTFLCDQTKARQEGQGSKVKVESVFSFDVDSQSEDSSEVSEDPDAITLEQIAHQFSEIQNIVKTVRSYDNPGANEELDKLSNFLNENGSHTLLSTMLEKLGLNYLPNYPQDSINSLNIPLVHPLKAKGESLRPLTTLGQVGALYLIWKLTLVHKLHHRDLIFSQMTELTQDFREHCVQRREQGQPNCSNSNPRRSEDDETWNNFDSVVSNIEVPIIVEKIHSSCPIPSPGMDNKSGSYHTVSEQDSDAVIPNLGVDADNPGINGYEPSTSNPNFSNEKNENPVAYRESISSFSSQSEPDDPAPVQSTSASSISSTSENSSPTSIKFTSQSTSTEEQITKVPWWTYLETKLVRGTPGHGILKFFRRYSTQAHHIFYSILIGRPIVISGSEEQRPKICRILTSLIPLIPYKNSKNSNQWKLLRWHRGILVPAHIKEYKLIGLCIPERLEVHDLINPRDQNCVTIFNLPKKSLLGPAYSGQFLGAFDFCNKQIQTHLAMTNSDQTMLAYIGGIFAEIETKIYMLKSLEEKELKEGKKGKNFFKELNLRASDIDIVRHLSGLVNSADDVLSIF